ncbi:hypothetical protein ACFE04_028980 [Oxalis oulophora]
MEEDSTSNVTTTTDQVLYETRHHASRPYNCNYPPLLLPQHQQVNDGGGLLSIRKGLFSQLKEKLTRRSKETNNNNNKISLYVSPTAQRLAVASGNQIAILRKEDDYMEPFATFTSGSLGAFTFGAWSELHDVLGVVDKSDTIYFIKANGEEITRITKKHFKSSSSVMGLITQDDVNAHSSCLCSFLVLTSDGFLHHVEMSQDPSTSISSSSSGSSEMSQFPQNVLCFDYYPKFNLLVVIGSAVSLTARGNSGSRYLQLWRKSQNLDLKILFSTQFEGSYSKQKDNLGHLAHPKVLVSPNGTFLAYLDVSGCMHIFKLDNDSYSLMKCATTEFLDEIVDFTWWSDHNFTVIKKGGIFNLLNVHDGFKVQKIDPVYSMPLLERAQQLQGHIFLLESIPCESSSDNTKESSDLPHINHPSEDSYHQCDVSRLRWDLISFSEKTVPEMYDSLISNHKYQAALDFADCHGLDKDEVFKAKWLQSGQDITDIGFLSNIKDQVFVLSECVDKVGPTEEATKALITYGLHITNRYGFLESKDDCSQVWNFRLARLQLLQFRDRLETYLGINMGRYSPLEYIKSRNMPINEAAVTVAESGKIGALNLLFKRHPYSVAPFMLQILLSIPETVAVQTYAQLLPGRSAPASVALREEDWVESDKMVSFIRKLPENNQNSIQIRTEPIAKRCLGSVWPSIDELCVWYQNRARDIDSHSGQLDNALCLVDIAFRKGIIELKPFHEDISSLHQLIYSDENDGTCVNMNLIAWEQLSEYEKFRVMLKSVKEETLIEKLQEKAIPFMKNRYNLMNSSNQEQATDHHSYTHARKSETFLVRWLKEIALDNKIDICLLVIEEGCKEFQSKSFFMDEVEVIDCALQCIYLCTLTDKWSTMAATLSKLPQKQGTEINVEDLEKRLKKAEAHIEAGRILAFYQVPKPINFFLEANSDEKGVKQIIRLLLSKFSRRQPGRSDNEWATMWRDMLCLREKAFPFLELEYLLMEFCRGLLKAGKFSLARNYLKGTSSVALPSEKAENLVIQAAREYFFSASSLSCSEIWKAKECLNLFPSSRNVKAEADIIEALTFKLPNLGVTLLPMQFRQIKDPMEIIKKAITSQPGAYLHVDELIEVAKLLGLSSSDDISAVEEALAREAAVAGDLQLAFDLCLVLVKKGHGPIWDLCAAIARGGPALDNINISARKQLIGFALSYCDDESISDLLNAWKDLDMQGQCETLMTLTGSNSHNFSVQGSSITSVPDSSIQDWSQLVEGISKDDQKVHLNKIIALLSDIAKNPPVEDGTKLDSFLLDNGKILSFAALQLPWLLELSKKPENGKKLVPDSGKQYYLSVRTHAIVAMLSWLGRNGFAPRDALIASLAKSVIEPPVSEEEDVMGCSFLLNLVDALNGVEVIEEQLKRRENYGDVCSIMNLGMAYSILHNCSIECEGPTQRRELLVNKFKENNTAVGSDGMSNIGKVQSSFWREWKLKLEEKKRVADRSRDLQEVIPGVETTRFLSGDINYIETVVFSLVESVKLEKKHVLKDVLRLAETYGLNRTKVVQNYLSCILVSEIWPDNDVMAEIKQIKEEILSNAPETIRTLSLVVYPTVDGRNKQRLAYIYGLLSDCYFQLQETKQSLPVIHPNSEHIPNLELAHFYKVVQQECIRISFVKNLEFKNIAGLGGLNLQCFSSEIYAHVDEFNLEALATMVKNLVTNFSAPMPEGLISWQDVYKHHIMSLLTSLASKAFQIENPEKFQGLISEVEYTYNSCKEYIRLLGPSDALDITKQYLTVLLPLCGSYVNVPDNSLWQECLIFLLNFWIKLTEDMQEIFSSDSSIENFTFNLECLMICLKALMKMVTEDNVSPSQGWATIIDHFNGGLVGVFAVEVLNFCRAMIFSGCGYVAVSEAFLEILSHSQTTDLDLPRLYVKIFEPILQDLVDGSIEHRKLYHLLSSLSRLEGDLEVLREVRRLIWEKMALFSNNLQIPNEVRVFVLELMQLITDKDVIKGPSSELRSNVLPWEGWSRKNETSIDQGFPDQANNLVALKSTQLVAAILPGMEISSNDLANVEAAVSCFSTLCEACSTSYHFDVLLAILDEWEGLFVVSMKTDEVEESINWSNDDWDDEGWESFQDIEEKEKKEGPLTLSVHPLHLCWVKIFKKLMSVSCFKDIAKRIDHYNGILLDEDDTQMLTQPIAEVDCFISLKLVLLLPYEKLQLNYLIIVEEKLKETGMSDALGKDHEFLTLVLSSGVISYVITEPRFGTVFSYLCYLVGNFSRQFQESRLTTVTYTDDFLFIFQKIIFPTFISELVKADQNVLAGFVLTKFMHTNASLSLINVSEASLVRYLQKSLDGLELDKFSLEDMRCCEPLNGTISKLKSRLGNVLHSALSIVSGNSR